MKTYFIKIIAVLITVSLYSPIVFAQQGDTLFVQRGEKGDIEFVRFKKNENSDRKMKNDTIFLKSMLKAKKDDEFHLKKETVDELGVTHKKFQQYYKKIKVENAEFLLHGKDGEIEVANGNFENISVQNIKASLSEKQALQQALQYIDAEIYKWQIPEEEKWIKEYFNDTYYPVGELVIVKDRLKTDSIYCLAYRFDIYAHKPMSRNYIWVDAITGDIIDVASRIMFANAVGTAVTRYSGIRTITTDSYNGSFRLRETRNGVNISTFNMNHTGNYTSTDYVDNDNNWTAAEYDNANHDNAALDAHWGAEMVYDYFKQVHSRNSWDNNNGALFNYVNGNLSLIPNSGLGNSDNAFWDGNKMTYGQGTSWPPVVTLDICAHEIAHGLFQSEVNYTNSTGEFGAINESLSDIWGACVENWATTNKQTWLCGEDLGFALRNMANPNLLGDPDTYGGTNWRNPANLDDDKGGVHHNCGVMNKWFYLLSVGGSETNGTYNVASIGIDRAAQIVYRAENFYMNSSTNFANARNATITAASSLYGDNSKEVISVVNAWCAVGVGNPIIIGPSTICSTGTYSLSTGHSATWSVSEGFTVTPTTGASVTVTSVANDGRSGTITAILNNITITTTVQSCVRSIVGPSSICATGTYSLNTGESPNWSVSNNNFSVSPTGISATTTVTALTANASGMVIAVYGGQYISYPIVSCAVLPPPSPPNPVIQGPDYVSSCATGTTFTLSTGQATGWSVNNSSAFTIVSSNATSASVKVNNPSSNGELGVIIAILGVSGGVSKSFLTQSCSASASAPALAVYPNPAPNTVNIEVSEEANNELSPVAKNSKPVFLYQVFDNLGNTVFRKETSEKKIQFNTSRLPNGIYFIYLLDLNDKASSPSRQTLMIKR